MNKKTIGTVILATSLIACTPSHEKKATHKKTHTSSLVDTTKKDTTNNLTTNLDETIFSYNMKELKKNHDALVTNSKRYNLLYALGSQDLKTIIQEYNPALAKTQKDTHDRTWTDYKTLDSLKVPAIFPSMKDFFSTNLDDFLKDKTEIQKVMQDFFAKYPKVKTIFENNKTCVITTKLPNNTMGTAYYENGKLQIAGPNSIGDGNRYPNRYRSSGEDAYFHARSPQGGFFFIDHKPHKRNRSGDAMCNFLEINSYTKEGNLRGLGYHGGQKVSGNPASHGCFRFPNMLSGPLAKKIVLTKRENGNIIQYGTPLFAAWKPYIKELDSVNYYTKYHPNLAKKRLDQQEIIEKQDTTKRNPFKGKIAKRLQQQKTDTTHTVEVTIENKIDTTKKKIETSVKDTLLQENTKESL